MCVYWCKDLLWIIISVCVGLWKMLKDNLFSILVMVRSKQFIELFISFSIVKVMFLCNLSIYG